MLIETNGLVGEGKSLGQEVMAAHWDEKEIMASPELKPTVAAFALQEIKAFRQERHQSLRLKRRRTGCCRVLHEKSPSMTQSGSHQLHK